MFPNFSHPADNLDLGFGPTLTWVTDEESGLAVAKRYLKACGMRIVSDRDFCHRLNNTHQNAINAAGYKDTVAKNTFLSRVARTPYGSASNLTLKAELLDQLHQAAEVDPRLLQDIEAAWK